MQRKEEYSTWPMWWFCKAAVPRNTPLFTFSFFHLLHSKPPLYIPPSPSECICLNQSHRRRSWIMYQPGFVNRFVNNAFGKEKRRREVKPDWEIERGERERELGRRAFLKKKKGNIWVGVVCGTVLDRPCRLVTPLFHLLLPPLKPASAQFGPVLALVTPPARTILHHTPTRPLTGPTDGINPSVSTPPFLTHAHRATVPFIGLRRSIPSNKRRSRSISQSCQHGEDTCG